MPEETAPTGSSGDQWLSSLLDEARNKHHCLPDSLFDDLEIVLSGEITERDLTPRILKTLATRLIGAMVPDPPEPEEEE